MKRARRHLWQDFFIIALSLVAAWAIVHYQLVQALLGYMEGDVIFASLIAGMFFTSVATTAPALAILGELSLQGNPIVVALVGGLGAVVGDYVLFSFVRDRVSQDASYLLRAPSMQRALHIFKKRYFRRALPIVGALIIASPLPDELGLSLLGLSGIKTKYFFFISYAMNVLGIAAISLAARGFGW